LPKFCLPELIKPTTHKAHTFSGLESMGIRNPR